MGESLFEKMKRTVGLGVDAPDKPKMRKKIIREIEGKQAGDKVYILDAPDSNQVPNASGEIYINGVDVKL